MYRDKTLAAARTTISVTSYLCSFCLRSSVPHLLRSCILLSFRTSLTSYLYAFRPLFFSPSVLTFLLPHTSAASESLFPYTSERLFFLAFSPIHWFVSACLHEFSVILQAIFSTFVLLSFSQGLLSSCALDLLRACSFKALCKCLSTLLRFIAQ